jgi:hypothetical protein
MRFIGESRASNHDNWTSLGLFVAQGLPGRSVDEMKSGAGRIPIGDIRIEKDRHLRCLQCQKITAIASVVVSTLAAIVATTKVRSLSMHAWVRSRWPGEASGLGVGSRVVGATQFLFSSVATGRS